ncbi:MAG: hypothetical protein ACRD9S_15670 [Pyrinomonadaceae bacterium]
MPMTFNRLGVLIASGVVTLAVVLLLFSLQYEIGGPAGWPATVKLYRKTLTGETRAVDAQTGQTLFLYRPEYDMNVHPVRIEKIDANHWQVVFEDPKQY